MKRNFVAWAALIVSSAALVSSQGTMRRVPAAPELPAQGQRVARELSDAFGAVAEFIKPSVVQISVQRKASANMLRRGTPGPNGPNGNMNPKDFEEMLRKFFGPDARPERNQFGFGAEGTGSGFVYDDKGHILTNNHVVEGAEKLSVTFHDGTEVPAKVVGTDPETDVAVIKVESSEYRPVQKGSSSKLRVGEWVMAVGSPFGLSQTVTAGIVSATERNEVGINSFESFIQTDAAVNPGNSGGPLVDMNGRVVGINSAIVTRGSSSNAGVGFAIPIDMASNLADKLIRDGKVNRSRLGIGLTPLAPVLAKQLGLDAKTHGIVVNQVVKGSPADKAGLKVGDVILGFAGAPVQSQAAFRIQVASSDAGQTYELKYYRDGKTQTTSVTLAREDQVVFDQERNRNRPSREAQPAETAKAEFEGYGLEVQPLTAELAKQFGYQNDEKGVVVSSVKPGSPAEAAGLEPGLLITKFVKDQKIQPVTDLKTFQDYVGKANEVAVYVQSSGNPGRFVTLSKASK